MVGGLPAFLLEDEAAKIVTIFEGSRGLTPLQTMISGRDRDEASGRSLLVRALPERELRRSG